MKPVALRADVQVWVCVNAREPGASLASCSRERGEEMVSALRSAFAKSSVSRAPLGRPLTVWVNRTLCQGFCHAEGVTVTVEPVALKFQAVTQNDVAAIVAATVERLKSL